MAEYQLLKDYADLGQTLGYSGEGLQKFVSELLQEERQRRAEERTEQKEKLELQLEIEKTKLAATQAASTAPPSLQVAVPKPKLPKYDQTIDEVDVYLDQFERYAFTNKWPRDNWANILSPLLTGKALQAYVSLPLDDASDYDTVKKAILQLYLLTEEGYRQKFRDNCPEKGETVSQFASRMCHYFDRWIELSGVGKTFESLRDLVLRE